MLKVKPSKEEVKRLKAGRRTRMNEKRDKRLQKRKEREAKKKEEREEMLRKGKAKTWNQPAQGKWRRGGVGTILRSRREERGQEKKEAKD